MRFILAMAASLTMVFATSNATCFKGHQASPKKVKPDAVLTPDNNLKQSGTSTLNGTFVNVDLEVSQTQWVIGTRLGLLGKLTNIAKVPLRFFERETVFIAPAEALIYGKHDARVGCAFFATEGEPALRPKANETGKGRAIVLQPGESYWVLWDFDTNSCIGQSPESAPPTPPAKPAGNSLKRFWDTAAQRIMFSPGNYKFILQTKFDEVADKSAGEATIHFAAKEKDVQIAASEGMILWGAAIGGILAFFVKMMMPDGASAKEKQSQLSRKEKFYRFLYGIPPLLGAIILSLAVVILSSRLGESAFPLKVSVSDFWGAITLGFVGNYVGLYLIRKLVESLNRPQQLDRPVT